jgi:uncharacterized membrane protein YphA (DoxX/SURF4 family)
METYNKLWRLFFAIALVSIAVQQFICSGFRPVIMPPEPAFIGQSTFCMCVAGILMILISAAIISGINSHIVADYLGAFMLLMIILSHIPYNIKINPFFLAGWNDAFKLLALCGGAFIVATSFPADTVSGIDAVTEKLRPAGPYFFATTMIVFGIEHFIYPKFVALLVPSWLPFHLFWAYFAGIALIAAGAAIVFKFKVKLAATLLGIMLFLWLVMIHIPRALDTTIVDRANEWTSLFEALAFSGIAFLIAGTYKPEQTAAVNN